MIQAIKDQKLSETDPKFIPHPATWLNAARWEDEIKPSKPADDWMWKLVK